MNRRRFLFATSSIASASTVATGQSFERDHEPEVRRVIQQYVDAREAHDPKAIEPLFTPDADQLVSDGTWRRGRAQLVSGMLESSRKNPAKRVITVQSIRLLAPASGPYCSP